MDIFKLILVPFVVYLIALIDRKYGSKTAGLLTGFPTIAFPLFLVLSFENSLDYLQSASLYGALGILSYTFYVYLYIRASSLTPQIAILGLALGGWTAVSLLIVLLPTTVSVLLALGLTPLLWLVTIRQFLTKPQQTTALSNKQIPARIMVSFIVTATIILGADLIGSRGAGILTAFPIAGSILLYFNAKTNGTNGIENSVRGLTASIPSLFCFFIVSYGCMFQLESLPSLFVGIISAVLTALIVNKVLNRVSVSVSNS